MRVHRRKPVSVMLISLLMALAMVIGQTPLVKSVQAAEEDSFIEKVKDEISENT